MNQLLQGDCLEVMRGLPDNSVDAVVTDPPYGLSFMGKKWDYDVPTVAVWREVLRVLKPGGHLLSFAGTRTQHRMAVNIEDAGFEIRDMIAWCYGCLDEQTEVATSEGVKPYHKTRIGDTVLCYNSENGEYSYQPILDIVEYDYSDTAYRLVGDFGEQVVSRNHRVIIERGGEELFELAETLAWQQQARVPVLESLPKLQQAVYDAQQKSGGAEQDMQPTMRQGVNRGGERRIKTFGEPQRQGGELCCMRGGDLEAGCVAEEGKHPDLQQQMQRGTQRRGVEGAREQGPLQLETRVRASAGRTDDGRYQPIMERGLDLPQTEGCLCRSADQVCSVSGAVFGHGTEGRLCDGAPATGGDSFGSGADSVGGCASYQPRCDRQPTREFDAVQEQQRPQGIRAWGGHKTAMVRIVPFHYTGKVWCLRVPTGAFVAVRNGVAFPTGNSGFPKSLDVSKAIDREAGADRDVVGIGDVRRASQSQPFGQGAIQSVEKDSRLITAPATPAAQQWEGWGTALKPALEPITLARKPLQGTVAANVQEWGTGAINVDGCRVEADESTVRPSDINSTCYGADNRQGMMRGGTAGRFPANLIHSGEPEVVSCFPESVSRPNGYGQTASKSDSEGYGATSWNKPGPNYQDSDTSAARFFQCCPDDDPEDTATRRIVYQAKASKSDRDEGLEGFEEVERQGARPNSPDMTGKFPDHDHRPRTGNFHPTVKPTELMRYLCRLITPPGGVILDPYMGSGSTGKAAHLEGFQFIGIEQDPEYLEIARARIAAAVQRSEAMTLEQRVAWLETQVVAQGAKLRRVEAQQQLSLFDALQATP